MVVVYLLVWMSFSSNGSTCRSIKCPLLYISTKTGLSEQTSSKIPSAVIFHENLSTGGGVVTSGRTDRHTSGLHLQIFACVALMVLRIRRETFTSVNITVWQFWRAPRSSADESLASHALQARLLDLNMSPHPHKHDLGRRLHLVK
jgi:hypothetical protein